MLKVGDKVKILPTIRSIYPDFPYVGVVGRVCAIEDNGARIGLSFCILAVTSTIVMDRLSRVLAGIVLGDI